MVEIDQGARTTEKGGDREKGKLRVIPKEFWGDIQANQTWTEVETVLETKEVRDPIFPKQANYCRLGSDQYVKQRRKKIKTNN
jgi:hypothetical protein